MKTRWYVWLFCFYLESTLHWIFKVSSSVTPTQVGLSFFTISNLIVGPVLISCIFLSFIRQTTNWIERAVLILSSLVFVLDATSTIHRLGYVVFSVSHQIPNWIFLAATVLLGYRTDQVLKYQDKRIETILCSTPS